jgi:hypothetical protein
MGAKLVAVEFMSCCPGSQEGCGGKKEESPRVAKGKPMSCPAEEKSLGEKVPENDS